MREALFILAIIVVLLGLTAIRYRRQIAGLIGLARALKDAKNAAASAQVIGRDQSAGIPLVKCAKCGVFIPQNRTVNPHGGNAYCSTVCRQSAKT